MDSVAELGRLFQILVAIVEPGSAAYQLAQSGITLAHERRSSLDFARVCVKRVNEKDRKYVVVNFPRTPH